MQENVNRTFEFQIAKKLSSDKNYAGMKLRKLKTDDLQTEIAEATVLAASTAEYESIKENLAKMPCEGHAEVSFKGVGKSLKITVSGQNANENLINLLVNMDNLEPEATRFLQEVSEFLGKSRDELNRKITQALGANCEAFLKRINMEKALLLLDFEVKVEKDITGEEFFGAVATLKKNDEFGIIK